MEWLILILCLALTIVILGILLSGGYRVRENHRKLQADLKNSETAARTILVRQTAGVVRIEYLTEPKELERESIQEIIARETAVAEEESANRQESEEERGPQDGVLIQRSEKLSFKEKYERLPAERRALLDEFSGYITEKSDCEKLIQAGAMSLRYRKGLIVKALIRRDAVILHFNILNPELGRMVREEKLKGVKVQPAEVRLGDREDLALAKETADMTIKYLQTEEEYKLEKRKAARREAARLKRQGGEGAQ